MNVQTHKQRMDNLEEANRVRTYRSVWKRRLTTREVTLIETFANRQLDSMKLVDALMALPWVGRVRTTRTLRQMHLSPTTTLGDLTYRQRVVLEKRFR